MRILLPFSGLCALFLAACSQPPPAVAPKLDLAVEEREIREMDARWLKAAQSHDPAAQAAMFASDGVAYREHIEPLVGPAAYQAYERKFEQDNPKQNITWTTDTIRVAESGDLAVQTGSYRVTGLGPRGDGEDKGSFVSIWKKVNNE